MLDKKLSAAEKVLLSAFDLLEHKQEFTAEDLIVNVGKNIRKIFLYKTTKYIQIQMPCYFI